MALPGHSPPQFVPAGSPPRLLNGHPDSHFSPPMYSHSRPMLPPSPQNFPPPRYQPPAPPPLSMSIPGSIYDVKGPSLPPPPPPPLSMPPSQNSQKRPSSSMSILSVLGDQPERPVHEPPPYHNPNMSRPGSISAAPMSIGAMMSPPQQPARVGINEYNPYGRSHTPDRIENVLSTSRQRSSSGPTRPLYEHDRYPKPPTPLFQNTVPFSSPHITRDDQSEGARRTSINSLLQRPSSQPQSLIPPQQPSRIFDPLPPQRPAWYADPPSSIAEPQRTNGPSSTYDTRPPGFRDATRAIPTPQPSSSVPPPSLSPEMKRATAAGSFNRGLANLLNGPTSQPVDISSNTSQNMARQDSAQSQSDRSVFGDRGRFRHFSPFAGQNSQHLSNGTSDDSGRKGSDELSYKSIIGLGLENGRRYSPVPQAVQGAQAQTPLPDLGVKSERGRVFSGIGGDIGPSSAGPTPTPGPKPASPFKKDDSASKMARTSSSIGKRSRKPHDDESRVDGENLEGKKQSSLGKSNKRTKYQNSYKADLEEMATPSFQRRGTPMSGAGLNRSVSGANSGAAAASSNTRYDTGPIFKPKKTVKLTTVMSQTLRKPRRHLGTFQYQPEILVADNAMPDLEPEVRIKPNILPSFPGSESLNCTYTIHIQRTWLQDRERRLICSTRNLWGTGIYTDDSDPLAAAMHMGWIKPSFNQTVDETLLKRVVQDQNPKVDVVKEFKPPSQPITLSKGSDLKITLVVMPQLERYDETSRFGVRSRSWPEISENTPHDGVSFAILKVEVLEIGPEERRMGRTGASRRARMQAQMAQRLRATKLEEERIARVTKRLQEKADQGNEKPSGNFQAKEKSHLMTRDGSKGFSTARSPLANEIMRDSDVMETGPTATNPDTDEWRRQLATAAA